MSGLIVLVCCNGLEYTRACVPTLLAQEDCNLLIVDNASIDGTGRWASTIADREQRVSTMCWGDRQSLAKVWNTAVQFAARMGYDRLLIVNNDTELMPDTYKMLSVHMTATPGKIGTMTAVGVKDRAQLVMPEDFTVNPHPDFSCFLLRIEAWRDIGGFDEGCIGAYFEDNIAHIEMHRKGWTCLSLSLPYLHHASGTVKTATAEEKKQIEVNFQHNRERFYKLYGCFPGSQAYEDLFK